MDPDLKALGVTVVQEDDDHALVQTDASGFDHLQAVGRWHLDRAMLERPFEAGRPVDIELARVDGEWWATTATQLVELPPELAEEGELREGIRFPPPAGG